MVSVVQLVERQIVVLVVVGSSPTVHPPKSRLLSEVCFFVDPPRNRGGAPASRGAAAEKSSMINR